MIAKLKNAFTGLVILASLFCAGAETPVEKHGWLKTQGKYLLNEHDKIVQLEGLSFFWSTHNWPGAKYYNPSTVDALVNSWNCTVVRVAYDPNDQSSWEAADGVVDAAISNGIYVIIDYHSHDAHNNLDAALNFFNERVSKYSKYPNVIFEPYNEPITAGSGLDTEDPGGESNANITWEAIKPYLTNITKAIRDAGAKNLIIIGTPYYCQHVHIAVKDPITNDGQPFENIAYSFHFYAASHGPEALYVKEKGQGSGRESYYLEQAIGLAPIFISEWGTSHSDGGVDHNEIDGNNTDWWFENYIDKYHLSWCNWSVSDFQSSSAFSGGTSPSASGRIVQRHLGGQDSFDPPWVDGDIGPAEDSTHDTPGTIAASRFNRLWGNHVSSISVDFISRDRVDGRKELVDNTALKVGASNSENWVTYKINSSKPTNYFFLRSFSETSMMATPGSGNVELYLNGEKIGDIAIPQNSEWTTYKEAISIPSGNHDLKLVFTDTQGDGYLIEWLDFSEDDTHAISAPSNKVLKTNLTISPSKSGFSVYLPQKHTYSSFYLINANGKVIKSGNISHTEKFNCNNISKGIWFLKLEGGGKSDIYKTLIAGR